jgi:4-hydroxybenzoate polyprenyltransferase
MMTKSALVLKAIKFEHTLFALPFALLSAFVAADGVPTPSVLGWILVAMVAARSSAMAVNRLADLQHDQINPRTASWPLAAGLLSVRAMWIFAVSCAGVLVVAAAMLNRLALCLSPVALLIVWGYSYLKRFTALCHFLLGLSLAVAPVGAWVAVRAEIGPPALVLGLAVLLWTAGFDIIYATQDLDFDRAHRLPTAPARLGIAPALALSAAVHALAFALLLWFKALAALGNIFLVGLGIAGVMLVYQHAIIRPSDLSRVNAAFFSANGVVSVALFFFGAADIYCH